MKKVVIGVFVLVVAAVTLILMTNYEYKEVTDVNWKRTFRPTDKEPYGTWIFRQLLEERYGEDNVMDRYKEIDDEDLDEDDRCLLVMIGEDFNFSFTETEALANFSNQNNDILLISYDFDFNYDWGLVEWNVKHEQDSIITINYPSLSGDTFEFAFRDSSIAKANWEYYPYFEPYVADTTEATSEDGFTVKKEEFDFSEILEEDDYDDADEEDEYDYSEEDSYDNYDYGVAAKEGEDPGYYIGYDQDSFPIYKEWDFEGETVRIHLIPEMFANVAAYQPFYLDHFNLLIGQYDYDKVIFEHPSYNARNRSEDYGDRESPIQFILENKSLKWSYYTLLLGALLYIIFRGKRKQRIVPTLAPNNNTSLEYVQTLGSLYEHQNKPRKLVKHMGDIFYHDVKARYFLDQHDQEFSKKLSKKSNIAEQEIELIVKTFSTIKDRFDFTDVHLSDLYRRLDAFYKKCK